MAHSVLFRGAISVYSIRHFQHTRHEEHKAHHSFFIGHLAIVIGHFHLASITNWLLNIAYILLAV